MRFCDRCNAVVGWFASYCDVCGERVGSGAVAADKSPAPAENTEVEKELFTAHIRVLHRFKEQVARIQKDARRTERTLDDLESRKSGLDVHRTLLGLSERVIDLEHEWEDIQRSYNAQSEALEEDFAERLALLESDIELAPDHQEAVDGELRELLNGLEQSEEKLREMGRRIQLAEARHKSRVFGVRTGPKGTLWLGVLAFALAAGGAAYGVLVAELPPRDLALALLPAWLGICILFLNARAKLG